MRKFLNFKSLTLIVGFIYLVGKVFLPIFQTGHLEHQLWSYYHLYWLGSFLSFLLLILYSGFSYLYIRKMKPGYLLFNLTLGIFYLKFLFEHLFSIQNIELVRQWYMESRSIRDFPVTYEKTQAVITHDSAMSIFYITSIIVAVLFIYGFMKRKIFINNYQFPKVILH